MKSYIFEEKQNDQNENKITNITSSMIDFQSQLERLKQRINDIDAHNSAKNDHKLSKQEKLRLWLRDTCGLEEYLIFRFLWRMDLMIWKELKN